MTTTNTYDSYGNLTNQLTVARDVHASSPLQGAEYHTEAVNTFSPNEANWCVGAPTQALIRSMPHGQATWATRTKSFDIDYPKCRANQEVIEPNGGALRVQTDYTYYTNGHLHKRTVTGSDMLPRETTYEYHPAGSLVTKLTNTLGQAVESEWSIGLDAEVARTDANGKRIEWGYDSLGRKIQERRPDGTRTDYQYFGCSTGCGHATGRYQIVSSNVAQGTVYGQSAAVYDMLGRVVQSTQWLLGGAQSHVLAEYDIMGRATRKSAPFWTGAAVYWSTTAYDLIGRPQSEQRQISETNSSTQTVAWSYEGLRTRQTDAEGKQITRRTNAIGQVVQMTDAASGHTWYQYDAFGNNTRTAMGDANGVETPGTAIVTSYDLRGRKDNSTDPDMGYWDYTFNALDELISQTDANNNQVQFQYDTLGRMTRRDETEGATLWQWDTATNGVGSLGQVTAPGYVESYGYDAVGRLQTTTTTIDATAYVVTTAYNSAGQVDTIEYPQSYPSGYRFKVGYTYDHGIVKKVTDATGSGKVYWEATDTDAAGALTAETLGNGIGISSWHDNVTGFLRQRYSGPGYNGSTQALAYEWDRAGNLKQRRDNVQSVTEDFFYDNLYRLDYSTLTTGGTTVTNLDMSYDALGNIETMSGAGTYTYHATKKHAVIRTTLNGVSKDYSYDNNGNMTSRDGSVIDWYTYNLPRTLRQGTDSSEFFYGPDGARYKQIMIDSSGTETTVYVGSWLERVTKPSGVIEYKHNIPGSEAGSILHTRRSNGLHDTRYLTKDHLGSVDTISNESGTVLARLSYDAFGKRRNFTGGAPAVVNAVTHRGFTGHEMLDNVELIHMNGRVYDPLIGRFISADPFVQEPLFSQSLNRYSYVANNPLSYVDPSGYSWFSKQWKKFTRALKRAWDALRGAVLGKVVQWIVTAVCVAYSWGADGGGSGCAALGYAAGSLVAGDQYYGSNSARGPPGSNGAFGGRGGGSFLPSGATANLAASTASADGGPADDMYGDPLFDTIVDVLKGALIPGYDLYQLYRNPNATWRDWAEAIASTAISLTPLKVAQLAFKAIKAVQKVRKARLDKVIRAPCCFAAGTAVKTKEGPKPIETIRVGDWVLAREEKTGRTEYKQVTQIFINDQMSVWDLDIVDASGRTETHHVTDNHPYWVVGLGWVEVADLDPGMALETEDGSNVNIVTVSDTGVVQRTYNLEVADFHTFFVGQQHVLVHNTCKVPDLDVDQTVKGARSKIDRAQFRKDREAFWKNEATMNPGKYSPTDLARMRNGRAPTGPDGKPMELHHRDGTPEGPLDPMSRTDHRGGANYKKNHPWLGD